MKFICPKHRECDVNDCYHITLHEHVKGKCDFVGITVSWFVTDSSRTKGRNCKKCIECEDEFLKEDEFEL